MSAASCHQVGLNGWLVTVSVSPNGLEARIGLERDEDGTPQAPPAPTVAALREALERAGVRHGLEEASLAALAASPEGPARLVARGDAPRRGVDSAVSFDFLADIERDPLHTVPAGTQLARKTPAHPGQAGTSVTGEPIPPPPVRDPPLSAAAGAVSLPGQAGQTRVIAGVDGRPVQRGGVVTVEQTITLPSIGAERADIDVLCSLRILEGISEGHWVQVKGRLTVGGTVDRARLYATDGISAGAGCISSHLRAGGLDPAHRALTDRLGAIEPQLRALGQEAKRLVAISARRGCRLRVGQALYALCQSHFSGIVPALHDALGIAQGPGAEGLSPDTEGAIAAAHDALAGLEAHRIGSLEELDALSARLSAEAEAMRGQLAEPVDARVNYLQACRVEASGSLIVTGRGVFNSEIRVSGDLVCEHPRGTVRGGRLHISGSIRTPELGAPGGAPVEVVLEGSAPVADRLVAARVHEGVKVWLGGRWHRFSEPRRDVTMGLDGDGQVLLGCDGPPRAAAPAGPRAAGEETA